jgi:hypothetical protein
MAQLFYQHWPQQPDAALAAWEAQKVLWKETNTTSGFATAYVRAGSFFLVRNR